MTGESFPGQTGASNVEMCFARMNTNAVVLVPELLCAIILTLRYVNLEEAVILNFYYGRTDGRGSANWNR